MKAHGLSLIVPAYNEAKRLKGTLPKIKAFFDDYPGDFEVIVVDDGSSDNSRQFLETFRSENPGFPLYLNPERKNYGKGYAVKEGYQLSKYEWILFSDADLSTPLKEIETFQNYTDTHDVIVASRDLPGSKVEAQPFHRKAMGRIFSGLSYIVAGLDIRDTQCGFKMFSRRSAQVIFPRQTVNGFGFDVELLYIAKKYNFAIKEVPVEWINDPDSKINNMKDSLQMFQDLFLVRYNDWVKHLYD